jgi:predicted MFS family arabinose efflux permease
VTLLLFRVPADRQTGQTRDSASYGERYLAVLRAPRARHLYALVALEGVLVTGGFTYLGAYLRARFGISYLAIGLILACYAGGTLGISRFVLRPQRWRIREVTMVVTGGICLGGGFIFLFLLPTALLAPLPILLMGVGFALFHSTLQTRATELLPARRGTAVALFAFSLFLGGGIGTAALGGVLTFSGYPLLLGISGVGMLLVTLNARLAW